MLPTAKFPDCGGQRISVNKHWTEWHSTHAETEADRGSGTRPMCHSLLHWQSQGYNQVPVTPDLPPQPRRSGVRRAEVVGITEKRSEAEHRGTFPGQEQWGVGRQSGQRSGLVSGDRWSRAWHQVFTARLRSRQGQLAPKGRNGSRRARQRARAKVVFAEPGGQEAGARQESWFSRVGWRQLPRNEPNRGTSQAAVPAPGPTCSPSPHGH